jgi:hypothetical protein
MLKLTKEEKTKLNNYPKVEMTKEEFNKLPEYSFTEPTQSGSLGVKRWKRRTPFNASDEDAIWFLGTIDENISVYHHIVILGDKPKELIEQHGELYGFFKYYKEKFGGGFNTDVLEITMKQYIETL